jgi:miniconductance mechanosensitive channel
MNVESFSSWITANPYLALLIVLLLSYLVYRATRILLSRLLYRVVVNTESVYDDLVVDSLSPFRIAWIVPLLLIYSFSDSFFAPDSVVKRFSLFLIIWVLSYFLTSIFNALNEIYEHRPSYSGVSIRGYVDLAKIFVVLIGLVLSVSLLTGESVVVLLSGLGALTAILLLIFQDTILAFVSNIQIASLDLIKEGDWLVVPGYDANGVVVNMTLHTITIQNSDQTLTSIPTRQVVQAPYKNFRGIQDSGGRRIKRSIYVDQTSIKFSDKKLLKELGKIDLLKERLKDISGASDNLAAVNDNQLTNVDLYISFVEEYFSRRKDVYQKGMIFLVRTLPPSSEGMGIETYIFTTELDWVKYEKLQRDAFNFLIAALAIFDLRIFQNPTSYSFSDGKR